MNRNGKEHVRKWGYAEDDREGEEENGKEGEREEGKK